MYSKASLEDVELRDIEGEPRLRSVGFELRPAEMRPNVWVYEPGQSNVRHRQREQEELYYVISGEGTMEVDGETFDVGEGDFVVVSPESWRQITADTELSVLVVGAPNVKDDAVPEE